MHLFCNRKYTFVYIKKSFEINIFFDLGSEKA